MIHVSGFLLTVSLTLQAAPATQPAHEEDEQMIRQSAAKYVEEYNRGDLDALMKRYTKDAEYDVGEGEVLQGRDAIRKNLQESLAAQPGTKLALDIKSIHFARNRAIETGVATLTPKDGQPEIIPYRVIHVHQPDGTWLIASVGPDVSAEGADAGPLGQLTWLVGTWSNADANVSSVCSWTRNRRFLLRSFVVKTKDETELEVSEVIGWDPAENVLRSWIFDSDGGFGQSVWSRKGEDWIISAKGVLPDGGRASAVNVIHPTDENSYTWSSINRDVDGDMLPDVEDIKMIRAASQPAADASDKASPHRPGHASLRQGDNGYVHAGGPSPRRSGSNREAGRQP